MSKGRGHGMLVATDGLNTLLTPSEAAQVCGVSAATVRKWASRGKITAAGISQQGAKLYRWGDVAHCERSTRTKAGRHLSVPAAG